MQHLFRTVCTAGFTLVLMLTLAMMPSPAEAAGYMKIAGVEGESTDKGHKNEIEILSWSWGESRPSTSTAGSATASSAAAKSTATRATTGAGAVDPSPAAIAAKRQHSSLTITKQLDRSSPMLQKAYADHQVFPGMTLSLPNPDGTSNSYLVYELKEVIITSYQTGASGGGDDKPTESVTLNFAKIKQTNKGAADGTDKTVDQN